MIIADEFNPHVEDANDLAAIESNRQHQERMRKIFAIMGKSVLPSLDTEA